MRKTLIAAILALTAFASLADVNTDKAMAKISRDTKTYISADARAAGEDEAYNEAMSKLTAKIAEYFKSERPGDALPDAVYLSNISSICERLTSKIADNRYRVMIYVSKSDLLPVGESANAMMLSKTADDTYTPVVAPEEIPVRADTVVKVVNRPLDPTLSLLSHLTTRDDMVNNLQSLSKSGNISGAAKFPLSHADNYYVVVIGGDRVIAILHYADRVYRDIKTSEIVDISKYSNCSAYWFTL